MSYIFSTYIPFSKRERAELRRAETSMRATTFCHHKFWLFMKAKKMERKEIGENPPSKQTCAFYIGTEKNWQYVDYYITITFVLI